MKRRKQSLPRLTFYAMSKAELSRLLNAMEAVVSLRGELEALIQTLRLIPRPKRARKQTEGGNTQSVGA